MNNNNLYLVYVNPIGKNASDEYEYDFFFSETPESVWEERWNWDNPSDCEDLTPNEYEIHKERLVTVVPLFCAQQNSCFSMGKCIDNVIALAFEDLTNYEIYPEPYRIVFQYGEKYESVVDKLTGREIYFETEKNEEK